MIGHSAWASTRLPWLLRRKWISSDRHTRPRGPKRGNRSAQQVNDAVTRAPDFIGFGRSDKPVDEAVYTFTYHRDMLRRFVERLDMRNITLVCQDWGGLLGLTLPMDMPGRFTRLLAMNTALGTGDVPLGAGFLAWREFAARNPDLDVPKLMARACETLSPEECAAYGAPFPDIRYKAGVRRFPKMVPDKPGAEGAELSRRARRWWNTGGMDRRLWRWACKTQYWELRR
jgi:pimeloyl-ACP methyl ester carboxylesterase